MNVANDFSFVQRNAGVLFYYTVFISYRNRLNYLFHFPTEEVQQTIERLLRSKRHLNIDMPDTDRSDSRSSLSCCVTNVIHSDTDVHIVPTHSWQLLISLLSLGFALRNCLGLCFLLGWCWTSLTPCSSWRRQNGHWSHFLEWWGLIVCCLVLACPLRWWTKAYTVHTVFMNYALEQYLETRIS